MNRNFFYTPFFSFLLLLLTVGLFNPLNAQISYVDYPWLNDIVNTADCCENETVTAYQSGIFTFIYIEKGADCADQGGELYFQDGTFYCLDINGMDCRAAYGLTESNATGLWNCEEEMSTVFSICLGDSVFLPALQDFPLPPVGPGGEVVFPDCQPQLYALEISPTDNSVASGLSGFYVSPTETTFYELMSLGTCGGPDATNADELIIAYEVIVEKNCLTERQVCDNILDQEWASRLTKEECTGNIYNITYNGQPAIYVSTLCACLDDANSIFDCKGTFICSVGGFAGPEFDCGEDISDQLINDNLIWKPACDCECPLAVSPVCGADGNMYDSACKATCAGVEILEDEACDVVEEICPALEKLSVNPDYCNSCMGEIAIYLYQGEEYLVTIEDNPICSDGITTVTNCDSTSAFCFNGGFAGFSQCNDFFKEAVLKEVIWSRKKDCNVETVSLALPCTDLTDVDFGLCLAIMGVGLVDDKCQTISGCSNYVVKGVDYSAAFFPTVEICLQECGPTTEENQPDIFDAYEWLADFVDLDDCKGTTVEVYDLGTYSFVHIQTTESGELYFGDGSFYCTDLPNYDCRALYNLTEQALSETWTCGDGDSTGPSGPSSPISGGGLIRNTPTNILISTPSLKAFPNPTNGTITVDLNNRINEEHTIRVFDLFGRLIQEKVVNTERTNISLFGEDAGVYFIETWDGTNRAIQKIIKQ